MHLAEYPFIYKENADIYLNSLAELIYRSYGYVSVNLLVAGGSAIIFKHKFRSASDDIDAYIESSVDITEQVCAVANMYGIPEDWLNSDFTRSPSASPRLQANAEFYKTYYNGILNVYLVCDLDLLCMKLISFRHKDLNDITNLIKCNPGLTQKMILDRLTYLYGGYEMLSYNARIFVTSFKLPEY